MLVHQLKECIIKIKLTNVFAVFAKTDRKMAFSNLLKTLIMKFFLWAQLWWAHVRL